MKPESQSIDLLTATRSKAKMYEFEIAEDEHVPLPRDPAILLRLAVAALGDASAAASRSVSVEEDDASSSLRFAARFFAAFAASRLDPARHQHLTLLAAAAYYLCDYPGNAQVLSRNISAPELDAGGLELLLLWILRGEFSRPPETSPDLRYRDQIAQVSQAVHGYYQMKLPAEDLSRAAQQVRLLAYHYGTPRELLLADAIAAIALRRIRNSALQRLPHYSTISLEKWRPFLLKEGALRELWPAQRALGERGVFWGKSAVVEMPTSAGKTRAMEVAIRAAFVGNRTTLAVIVAPFRALCHEIRQSLIAAFYGEDVEINSFADVLQNDLLLEFSTLVATPTVLVMTPEKLVYVLRHQPALAGKIGVLVFDEGHQFDDLERGVTYELLVTALKKQVSAEAQKILVSAVISNASVLAEWLVGDAAAVVGGAQIMPTERSVAFASWKEDSGELSFVSPDEPTREQFVVPRVLRSSRLSRKPREQKDRLFPARRDERSISIYLGLKLAKQGGVAVFSGRKDSALVLCRTLLDVASRNPPISMPREYSDGIEIDRIATLYERNLGPDADATRAAKLGVLTHHGNTPHGIRLAVEFAMKEGFGRFVVCTSTLAQGVNLPIRYLIVYSTHQGGERIKARDFQNLMGRAGRADMHTEGTVIFANHYLYDTREDPESQTRWEELADMVRPGSSEPCGSMLLDLLAPLRSDGRRVSIDFDVLGMARDHVGGVGGDWVAETAQRMERQWFSFETLAKQLAAKKRTLKTVESFLFANWSEVADGDELSKVKVSALVRQTLAYHLADDVQRAVLEGVFEILASAIAEKVPSPSRRQAYGRTLLGAVDAVALEEWVLASRGAILASSDVEEMFGVVWSCVAPRIENRTFRSCPQSARDRLAERWIRGDSFGEIWRDLNVEGVRVSAGKTHRHVTVEHVVDIAERGVAFEGSHLVGAIAELIESVFDDRQSTEVDRALVILRSLQRRMRYGLSSDSEVLVFEIGFSDRVLARELVSLLPGVGARAELVSLLGQRRDSVRSLLESYPAFFGEVFSRIVG